MQQEVELSKQRHARDLDEKKQFSRLVGNKVSIINSWATLLSLYVLVIVRNDDLLTNHVIFHHISQKREAALVGKPTERAVRRYKPCPFVGICSCCSFRSLAPGKYIPKFRLKRS